MEQNRVSRALEEDDLMSGIGKRREQSEAEARYRLAKIVTKYGGVQRDMVVARVEECKNGPIAAKVLAKVGLGASRKGSV